MCRSRTPAPREGSYALPERRPVHTTCACTCAIFYLLPYLKSELRTLVRRPYFNTHEKMAVRSVKSQTVKTPPSVKKCQKTLVLLANSKPKVARKIIKSAGGNVLKAISEICLNMLNGVINLSSNQKKKLKKHRAVMRKLTEKNTLTTRRKLLQKGNFIGSLLSIGLPLLIKGISALVSYSRSKKSKK